MRARRRGAKPIRACGALLVALLAGWLTACADAPAPPAQPGPEGELTVMGGAQDLRLDAPPADWIVIAPDRPRAQAFRTTTIDGLGALELASGTEPAFAVRRTDAWLLATPYLMWSWHLSNHGEGIHPMRVIVGFIGGAPEDADVDVLGGALPPHDRALAMVWGDTMLKRGTLSLPAPGQPTAAPLYTVRGGRENTRAWWREAVDLSNLYARAWPGDAVKRARVAFIGIAAAPRTPPVRGRIADIILAH